MYKLTHIDSGFEWSFATLNQTSCSTFAQEKTKENLKSFKNPAIIYIESEREK